MNDFKITKRYSTIHSHIMKKKSYKSKFHFDKKKKKKKMLMKHK